MRSGPVTRFKSCQGLTYFIQRIRKLRRPLEEGEGGRRNGKARAVDQTAGMTERASTPLSICPSDPQGRDEAVAQEGAKIA